MRFIRNNAAIHNAIIWAAMMIATSIILSKEASQVGNTLMMLQIMGWFSTNLVITKLSVKK